MKLFTVGVAVLLSTASVLAFAKQKQQPRIPGVPTNVTATATSPSSVHVTWTDNSSNETGFRVERSRDQVNWNRAGDTAADVSSFDDVNLNDNTTFHYRVLAFDNQGSTEPSTVASATTPQGFWSISGKVVEGNDFVAVPNATITLERGANAQTPLFTPNKAIPDGNSTGITEHFQVTDNGNIEDISVSVKITHTYIGDLRITLIHPDGTRVILHGNTGGSSDNLETVYPTQTTPNQPLTVLKGKALVGQWGLEVVDSAGSDSGTLNSFQLSFTGATAALTATSDALGFYSFSNVPSGKALMWVDAPGLHFNGREVELRNNMTRVNFVSDLH